MQPDDACGGRGSPAMAWRGWVRDIWLAGAGASRGWACICWTPGMMVAVTVGGGGRGLCGLGLPCRLQVMGVRGVVAAAVTD